MIADFRKNNHNEVKSACRQFVQLCKQMNMFSESLVAIHGSRFRAVNNRDRNFTKAKIKRRIEAINKCLDRYISQLKTLGRRDQEIPKFKMEKFRLNLTHC